MSLKYLRARCIQTSRNESYGVKRMKFLRHVLSHLSLIISLVFICAVIYFRADLLPEDIQQPINNGLDKVGATIGMDISLASLLSAPKFE